MNVKSFVPHRKMAPSRMNNRTPLQSLAAANVMIEGSIIGYESNVKSGGVGRVTSVSVQIPSISSTKSPLTCAWSTSAQVKCCLRSHQ
jgi:curli biogenesis system outer membrane secretion channel CsgG